MILCDTGIIVAVINSSDNYHVRSVSTISGMKQRLITTQACITESMYLIRDRSGWPGQQALIGWLEAGFLNIHPSSPNGDKRACALMRHYADAPMDYADATLVVAAEELGIARVLTIDKHFYAYRIHDKTHFEVLP